MNKFVNPTEIKLQDETVIAINKVSKATTGGRKMGFNCIVCVGDGKSHVGLGFGKANEVASAVNKAKENAKKNLFKVPIIKGTIPHELKFKFGSVRLMLKPASAGTGIIAGGPIRVIMQQVGISDILTKTVGSTNAINVVKAVEFGLKQLRDPITISRQRGIKLKNLFE